VLVGSHVTGDPVGVAQYGRRTRDPEVLVEGKPGQGDIGFVGAPLIQHSGVDRASDRYGDVGRAQPLQDVLGVGALDEELPERRLVVHRHRFTGSALLGIDPRNPVRLAPRVVDHRL
jgi:hypothetical protein